MKREVRREIPLKSFSIGTSELALIWTRLDPLFESIRNKRFYLDIGFENETITLESLDELRTAPFPALNSTDFTLHFHGENCSVHVYTPPHVGPVPKLVVLSESEVWAAGARDVVLSVLNQNRAWHSWVPPWLLTLFAVLSVVLFFIILGIERATHYTLSAGTLLGMGATFLALSLLALSRKRLLPLATLRLRETESVWRRYSVELTLALAAISVLLTVYGLLAPK